jgi:hypothetical protein
MRAPVFLALALLLGSGCSSSPEKADSNGGGATGGSGGSGGASQVQSVEFLDAPTRLVPRQELTLTVQVSPAGRQLVRFSLPTSEDSEPLDAVLDRSEVETDETGRASAVLLASSSGASFRVRASVGSAVAELALTVTDVTGATVEVHPTYSGKRRATTWVATAREGSCADGPVIPPPDGPMRGFAASDRVPEIVGVPVKVPVAITLRSGHYMGGCASVEMFPAGPANRRHVVKVTVLDRPIELTTSHLSLSLALDPLDTAFVELNQLASASALTAMRGGSTDDADALLDAMRAALDSVARQELDIARNAEGWDDLLRARWGQGAPTRLRDRVASWLTSGAARLNESPALLEATLRPVDGTSAELQLSQLAGLSPAQAGLVSSALVSWSADADDTVVLGTDLYFSSSRLATGLAEPVALEDFPEAVTAAAALGLALDCVGLADELAATGSDTTFAYPGCDAACLNDLCNTAVASIWQRGRDVSSSSPVRLAVTAAGEARVGDAAEIAGIVGSWVGELTSIELELDRSTRGVLSAVQPAE